MKPQKYRRGGNSLQGGSLQSTPREDFTLVMTNFVFFVFFLDATEQRKRALFLGYCGNRLYKTARTLAAPKDVEAMEWKELQKMLEEHYAPAASSLAHRLDFYHREQKPGCEFENVEITLRDRIVVGMRDLRLQRKLITKKSISLNEVMEVARAAEISEKPTAKIEKSESVHSALGMTNKYQGEGEIGELSEEEEEEIHRKILIEKWMITGCILFGKTRGDGIFNSCSKIADTLETDIVDNYILLVLKAIFHSFIATVAD
ncbi:hypothetical protein E2320_001836 [Naja naja]|nr:hypothetical protein E2320_001836 [Naja naja]